MASERGGVMTSRADRALFLRAAAVALVSCAVADGWRTYANALRGASPSEAFVRASESGKVAIGFCTS